MSAISVDLNKCQGYANCVVAAPHVFDLSEDGKVLTLIDDVDAADREAVADAVAACPAGALTLEGS
ncbi:ferredoxin [Streptomyces sp. AJS327]|uniref:ferredoxin n=1 Tax=Streptomyces sp. AJS327 TaxID=2545265 RepID=UPI0015DF8745|nr:ferredoxin [Streptomyces sp. AJS327]MBA0052608.1 ferredoxin [Streptomyces sp. AJS327]